MAFLADYGLHAVSSAGVDTELSNYGQGELSPAEIIALARRADCASAEALVLSCTDMRAAEVRDYLETELGKPVVTSNTASFWAALRRVGIDQPIEGYGRLFAEQ